VSSDDDPYCPGDVTARLATTCATWAAPANSIQAGASAALIVRRTRPPWSVLTAGTEAQGSFLSWRCRVGMLPLTVIT
jgi:hypothetical protein